MRVNSEKKLYFIRGIVKFDEPMNLHTTFKIGGPADVWIEPLDTDDLMELLGYARANKINIFIVGGGSKILVGDKGVRGIVICMKNTSFKRVNFKDDLAEAGCGIGLWDFISEAAQRNLGGCGYLAGVPGTLGGAIVMNAGWPSNAIGDLVEEVTVIKDSDIVILKRKRINFSYRSSGLDDCVLISGTIRMKKKPKEDILAELKNNRMKKTITQDLGYPSIGCIFKNPSLGISAGKLIEASGFKGRSFGGAHISEKHANFIINRGKAKASDVLLLIEEIQKKVFKDSGIMLKLEVKLMGEF